MADPGGWKPHGLKTGWAVSITTNCDPNLNGFNRYQYVLKHEIAPARKMNVDGIYFDSMEWTGITIWITGKITLQSPIIRWHFQTVDGLQFGVLLQIFEFMKKSCWWDALTGKTGNGKWTCLEPFAASNLDLFGAELSWYSSDNHNTEALDFNTMLLFTTQEALLCVSLNDKGSMRGYVTAIYRKPIRRIMSIYFLKKCWLMVFFHHFFSVDASNDSIFGRTAKE